MLADAGPHGGGRGGFNPGGGNRGGGSQRDGSRGGDHWGGRDRGDHHWDGRDHHSDSRFSIGIGLGFYGGSYGGYYGGYYNPYPYYGSYLAYSPNYWPTWSLSVGTGWGCSPGIGFYYHYNPWFYHPYWYRHHYLCYSYACPPQTTWIINYGSGYGCAPSYTFSTCGLISPEAVVVSEPSSVWTYSTNGVYKYAWLNSGPGTVDSPAIASESLPAPTTFEQLQSNSDRELGDTYLRLGDLSSAARIYSNHLAAFPGDARAIRSLGVAMIASGQAAGGAQQIDRAYRIDPTLARTPFAISDLPDRSLYQGALDEATRQAGRGNTQADWLAVAALMQADGQVTPARAALERAKAAGLESRIAEEFQAAMPIPGQ